jgi:hypothetical protein
MTDARLPELLADPIGHGACSSEARRFPWSEVGQPLVRKASEVVAALAGRFYGRS